VSRFPLRHLGERLVLTDDEAWAWFTVPTVAYDFLSEDERDALLDGTVTALAGLSGAECHLLLVPDAYDPGRWAAQLEETTDDPAPGWPAYLRVQTEHLAGGGFSRRRVFLGIALGRRGNRRGVARRVHDAAGLDDPTVSTRELERWRVKVDSVERVLAASALRAQGASVEDLRWLVQAAFWRGLPAPPPGATDRRPWGRGALESLAESTIRNGYRSLVLSQPGMESHLAFLSVARFPEVMTHPGSEWLSHSDVLGFPVEASLRFRLVPPHQASADAAKKLAEASDQARHIARTSADVPLGLLETTEQARHLEYAVTKEGLPLVYGSPRFCVAGASAAELDGRVEYLVEAYRDLGIELARPAGDQLSLFLETLPGDRVRVRAYEQRQALVTLAGGMFAVTSDLGDAAGPYIGETTGRARTPVHFDPLAAAQRNLPTAIAITGAPGGGKTHLAELLLYQLAMRGAWGMFIDPKNEAGGLADLAGLPDVQVLQLGPEHEGLLDPFAVAATPAEASLLAADVLRLLLPPGMAAEQESALLEACRLEAEVDSAHLAGVVGRLESMPGAGPQLAQTIRNLSQLPLARLCFASGPGRRLEPNGRLLVVQLQGVAFPQAGTPSSDYTVADRLAVAVMFLVTTLAARLADASRAQAKAIVLDEAWALTASRQGRALVQRLARTGRSKNLALLLVSQNAADFLGPEVQNNFSSKFSFRSTQEDEVLAVLRLLGVDPSLEHVRTVRTLSNGECAFADVDGRVGTLRVDLVLPELMAAFDTTPRPVRRRRREPAR
jgi:hypothetical protein